MWLEDAGGFAEFCKGTIPYYLLIVLPILIIISPAYPVAASHEFTVFRMQHYDIHGIAHGCRNAPVNLEARSLNGWGTSRHCVVTFLQNLTVEHFRDIRAKAGALLVILPREIHSLSPEEKQHLLLLEDTMLAEEILIPVYFASWSPGLEQIVSDITQSYKLNEKTMSASEALLNAIAANGYQMVISSGSASARQDIRVATIQGRLAGLGAESKTATIAIVAHYDSFGVAPELSYGADSNGSGVAVLFELARLFSILYSSPKTHGKYNVIFLLTGGGKFNYQGSKKWLEDQLDSLEGSVIQDASYVMCLDSLSSSNSLYMHVSKPPKENTPAATFFHQLKEVSQLIALPPFIDGVHKKINLGDARLAWEHERYSMRRLPAFTLSALRSHRDLHRTSILDVSEPAGDVERLVGNTRVIAEALARQIYNFSQGELFQNNLSVSAEHLATWLLYLSSQPRSAQLHSDKQATLVSTLRAALSKHARDVKVSYVSPDKREPEFMFYDVTSAQLNVYSVKPAVFDLVLTMVIAAYLCAVYLLLHYFPALYQLTAKLTQHRHQPRLKTH